MQWSSRDLIIKYIIVFFLVAVQCIFIHLNYVAACTVFGATGQRVSINGTIVAKNRDNSPHLFSSPRVFFPVSGFKFFGLYDVEADGFVIAGINEKNLAVLNASATSVPREKREVATEDTTERLLTSFDSVDDIIARRDIFEKSHPAIYMVADAKKIAVVEVAPNGSVAIKKVDNGTLAFTNHYTHEGLSYANEHISENSKKRLERIGKLIESKKTPLSMNDFIKMSNDRAGGPNDSIWRTGDKYSQVRTLASFVVSIPVSGLPEIYVRISNPKEADRIINERLDFSVWSKKD